MKTASKHPSNENEDKFYGFHASMMIFKERKKDIKKVYVLDELTSKVSKLLSYCAKNKIAYKVVDQKALESVSGSVHHEGLCLFAKKKPVQSQASFISKLKSSSGNTMVLLDNVKNPHNVGAMVRCMAHFGASQLIYSSEQEMNLSGANYRIAEGGYEYIEFIKADNLDKICHELKKAGYKILGTSSHTENSLYSFKFPEKSVIVLGNEVSGMSKKMQSLCDDMILIPGTGNVESLNVSQSLGLMLGEKYRQESKG